MMPIGTDELADMDSLLNKQRRLWEAGERPEVDNLWQASALRDDEEALLDLLYNEIVLREQAGESPNAEEYSARYPHLAEALAIQFEVHQAVSDPSLLETDLACHDDSWPETGPDEQFVPQLKNYEVIREIGRGGSAIVYLARDRRLGRNVALKLIRTRRQTTTRELLRFKSEARAVARLAHPNIVQVFEVGECEGSPYLAIEYLEGGTLAQKLQKLTFTPLAGAQLIESLARALHHAHDRQVIHRDLKPANVLFTQDGTPKIADFGLAKVFAEEDHTQHEVTGTGEPVGTPRYMSPEQAAGQQQEIGPATDVYALGTLLYECLTGQAPFISASMIDTLQKIRHDEPISPRRLQRAVPRDLATICLHCLHKEPSRRYSSAQELAEDLARLQRGEPIHARPVTQVERLWKWSRRRPGEAGLIAVVVALLLLASGGVLTAAAKERFRLAGLRQQIASLMSEGQQALGLSEFDEAEERFAEAWRIVQAEPALADHTPGVAGWLDHAQRASSALLWQGRLPPREFDQRLDEAIVESLLLEPAPANPAELAQESIAAARELTLADDPAWKDERVQLALLEAGLIAFHQTPADAVATLEPEQELSGRLLHDYRSKLFAEAMQTATADQSRAEAERFPPDHENWALLSGIDAMRRREFEAALGQFETVIGAQPSRFIARLLHGVCLWKLNRPAEARIALTACIAQRPTFPWTYYFRSQVWHALSNDAAAAADLRRIQDLKPTPLLIYAAEQSRLNTPN